MSNKLSEKQLLQALGARVRSLREAAGLSQRELAERVPCAPSLISRLERGSIAPSVMTLHGIAVALGTTVAALFGDLPEVPDLRRLLRNPDARVIYGGRELSDREKERLLELIDAALALKEEAEGALPAPLSPMPKGPIAASMVEREAYGRHDPALNAYLYDVIQKALEDYDRKHGRGGPGRRES